MANNGNDVSAEAPGTQIARIREAASLPMEVWADERIKTIAKVCAPPEASVPEIAMFLAVANRYELDPLAKEIWLAKDERQKIIILTGRDAFLKVARRSPDYVGMRAGIVHEKDTFKLTVNADRSVEVLHQFGFPRGKMLGAYCVVDLRDRPPVWIAREIDDYAHLLNKNNWKNYKPDMFLTRVITSAHRIAFNLSGLYAPEDFIGGELETEEDIDSRRAGGNTRANLDSLAERIRAKRSTESGDQDIQDADFEVVADSPFPEEPQRADVDAAREANAGEPPKVDVEGEQVNLKNARMMLRQLFSSSDIDEDELAFDVWLKELTGKQMVSELTTKEIAVVVKAVEEGSRPKRK